MTPSYASRRAGKWLRNFQVHLGSRPWPFLEQADTMVCTRAMHNVWYSCLQCNVHMSSCELGVWLLKDQQRVLEAHISFFIAGTTFTMAVLYGKLLTVANVGDSKAFLDTGSEIVELSTSHRIEDNIGITCTLNLNA